MSYLCTIRLVTEVAASSAFSFPMYFSHLLAQYCVQCESVENGVYAADWCDH